MPAPRKLTAPVAATIVDALRAGNYVEQAVAAAGIHKATYYRWIAQGETDLEAGEDTAEARLCDAVARASADSEAEYVAMVKAAGERGSWQAATWFLERRYPSRWGKAATPLPDRPTGATKPLEDLSELALEQVAMGLMAGITGAEPDAWQIDGARHLLLARGK